jgi:hypothetical protein
MALPAVLAMVWPYLSPIPAVFRPHACTARAVLIYFVLAESLRIYTGRCGMNNLKESLVFAQTAAFTSEEKRILAGQGEKGVKPDASCLCFQQRWAVCK